MVDNLDNLNNERTAQLDLGLQAEHGAWSTWASVYAGLIKDFILLEYNTPDKRNHLRVMLMPQLLGQRLG